MFPAFTLMTTRQKILLALKSSLRANRVDNTGSCDWLVDAFNFFGYNFVSKKKVC